MTKKEREEIKRFLGETEELWRTASRAARYSASQHLRRVYYDGRIDSLEWVLRMANGALSDKKKGGP